MKSMEKAMKNLEEDPTGSKKFEKWLNQFTDEDFDKMGENLTKAIGGSGKRFGSLKEYSEFCPVHKRTRLVVKSPCISYSNEKIDSVWYHCDKCDKIYIGPPSPEMIEELKRLMEQEWC